MAFETNALVPIAAALISIASNLANLGRAARDLWRWLSQPAAAEPPALPPAPTTPAKPPRKRRGKRR